MEKRPRTLVERADQIVRAGFVVRLLAERLKGKNSYLFLNRFLKRYDKDCLKLQSEISLWELRVKKRKVLKKQPGAGQVWTGFSNPYRCWSCTLFGTSHCDNPFLNRPGCSNHTTNPLLMKKPERYRALMERGKGRMKKLKLPQIKSFSEHLETCKTCEKIKPTKRYPNPLERKFRHYWKYKRKRIKKLASFLAFYGIPYGTYIEGWEE